MSGLTDTALNPCKVQQTTIGIRTTAAPFLIFKQSVHTVHTWTHGFGTRKRFVFLQTAGDDLSVMDECFPALQEECAPVRRDRS